MPATAANDLGPTKSSSSVVLCDDEMKSIWILEIYVLYFMIVTEVFSEYVRYFLKNMMIVMHDIDR